MLVSIYYIEYIDRSTYGTIHCWALKWWFLDTSLNCRLCEVLGSVRWNITFITFLGPYHHSCATWGVSFYHISWYTLNLRLSCMEDFDVAHDQPIFAPSTWTDMTENPNRNPCIQSWPCSHLWKEGGTGWGELFECESELLDLLLDVIYLDLTPRSVYTFPEHGRSSINIWNTNSRFRPETCEPQDFHRWLESRNPEPDPPLEEEHNVNMPLSIAPLYIVIAISVSRGPCGGERQTVEEQQRQYRLWQTDRRQKSTGNEKEQ